MICDGTGNVVCGIIDYLLWLRLPVVVYLLGKICYCLLHMRA